GCEVRMQLDVHEAGRRAEDGDLGRAGDGVGIELAVPHEAKRAGAFRDENVSTGKKFDGARRGQPAGDDGDADVALLPGFEIERTVAELRGGPWLGTRHVGPVALGADAARRIGDAFDVGGAVAAGRVGALLRNGEL